MHRLHLWFALSSLLMTACLFWLVWVDYDRAWRHHQDDHFANKAVLAYLDYTRTLDSSFEDRLEGARRKLDAVRAWSQKTHGADRLRLETESARAQLEAKRADTAWSQGSQRLEIVRDEFERLRARIGPDLARQNAVYRRYAGLEQVVEQNRRRKEHWDDEVAALTRSLRGIDAPVLAAEKGLRAIELERRGAEAQYRRYRGLLEQGGFWKDMPVVGWVINLPFLDFAAPKNTPARQQINQLVLPDVRVDLHYTETRATDRCTTCHVAIADPAFLPNRLAATLRQVAPAIDTARRRQEKSPLDWPAPPTETEDEQGYLESLIATVNAFLTDVGLPPLRLDQPLHAHPNLDLYVGSGSNHPASKMGCTVCHEGNGHATDFVLAGHTPRDETMARRWDSQYTATHIGVPGHTPSETVDHWSRPMTPLKYLDAACARCHEAVWDLPRFGHGENGAKLVRGRHLFASLGCVNCHPVEDLSPSRRVGPDLRRIASKLAPAFARQWILDPQRFRPGTRMPHFFGQENNRAAAADEHDPDPALRSFAEVFAITRYLFAVSDRVPLVSPPRDEPGKPAWGREMVKSLGCLACHANLDEYGRYWIAEDLRRKGLDRSHAENRLEEMSHADRVRYAIRNLGSEIDAIPAGWVAKPKQDESLHTPIFSRYAPDFTGMGSKVGKSWLYTWLRDPKGWSDAAKMPNLRLGTDEAAHVAAYLASLKYSPFDMEADADMSRRAPRLARDLLFSLIETQESTRRAREMLDDTGGALTETLVSRLAPSMGDDRARAIFTAMSIEDRRLALFGAKMISHYGCHGCHQIRGFENAAAPGTDLSQWAEKPISRLDFGHFTRGNEPVRLANEEAFRSVFPADAEQLTTRSNLGNPNAHVTPSHASFAEHKLSNPRIWDRMRIRPPYEKLKMPNFYLTPKERDALVTFLLSRKSPGVTPALEPDPRDAPTALIAEGRRVMAERNCTGCHEVEGNKPIIHQYMSLAQGGGEGFDPISAPPSLRGAGAKVQTSWLYGFLDSAEPIRDWMSYRMPSFHLSRKDRGALARLLVGLSAEEAKWLNGHLEVLQEHLPLDADEPPVRRSADGAVTIASHTPDVRTVLSASIKKEQAEESPAVIRARRELRWYADGQPMAGTHSAEEGTSLHARVAVDDDQLRWRLGRVADLLDVSYPTMDVPKERQPEIRLKDGLTLFESLNCMACHWFNDPANRDPKRRRLAPNLRMVYRRLRREWVREYLEKPRRALPYTYMPDLFGDDVTSPFYEWVPAERKALQSRLNDPAIMDSGREVIGAMTDFLFDAGATYRSDTGMDLPLGR